MNRRRFSRTVDILGRLVLWGDTAPLGFHMRYITDHLPDCGTVACALGHAALDPQLQAEGLQLFVYDMPVENITSAPDPRLDAGNFSYVQFQGRTDFAAAAAFYDIPFYHAEGLFEGRPGHYSLAEVYSNFRRYLIAPSQADRDRLVDAIRNGETKEWERCTTVDLIRPLDSSLEAEGPCNVVG